MRHNLISLCSFDWLFAVLHCCSTIHSVSALFDLNGDQYPNPAFLKNWDPYQDSDPGFYNKNEEKIFSLHKFLVEKIIFFFVKIC